MPVCSARTVAKGLRDWCHQFDLSRPMGDEALRPDSLVSAEACVPKAASAVPSIYRTRKSPGDMPSEMLCLVGQKGVNSTLTVYLQSMAIPLCWMA